MSPQALLKSLYGPKTDVWAFGILLYEFFHNKTPFQYCLNTQQLEKEISHPININSINSQNQNQNISTQISQDAKKLITMCLTHDYHERPSFRQLWSEGYIKSLRLKSYVQKKTQQLSCYKQIVRQALRKQVEKNRSLEQLIMCQVDDKPKQGTSLQTICIQIINDDGKLSRQQQQNEKNSQSQQQRNLNSDNNDNTQGYSFDDFLKMNIEINDGNKLPSQFSFQSQMQQFYRQAQNMMMNKQQQSHQLMVESIVVPVMMFEQSEDTVTKVRQNDDETTKIKTQSIKHLSKLPITIQFSSNKPQQLSIINNQSHQTVNETERIQSLNNLFISAPKKNSAHKQNLKKFVEFLDKKSSYQDLTKSKQKFTQKLFVSNKDSFNIDLILVLLEFTRFIVKYIKFNENLHEFFAIKKFISLSLLQQQIQSLKLNNKCEYFCENLYNFCQEILMKKVSQIIFTLNTEKSQQLFQIVKTHKSLLNGLKASYKSYKVNMKVEIEMLFKQIEVKIKKVEEVLTVYMENDNNNGQQQKWNQQQRLMIWRLCWIGLWWAVTYNTFLQLQQYLVSRITAYNNITKNHQTKDFRTIMKKLQQFIESHEDFINRHSISNADQQQEIAFNKSSKHNNIQNIQNDINYFFQLAYEIQLRKINLDNQQ